MPRRIYSSKLWPDELAYAMKVFASPVRVGVLATLDQQGPLLRIDLMNELQMDNMTVGRALTDLEALGIVKGDLPPERRRGRSVKYSVDPELYAECVKAWLTYVYPAKTDSGPTI